MRIVALIVLGPAKPINARGSAKTTSPSEAKLAATPPIVGLVNTEMNGPPAESKRASAADDLGHLHQGEDALVHAGAAARTGDDNQRQLLGRGAFDGAGEFFADDRAHAAHDEGGIGHAEGDATAADHAGSHHGRFPQPGALLLFLEPLRIGDLVDEVQRVGRFQVGVPLLERALVEHLRHPLPRRDVPVVVALGANSQPFLRFLAEDRGLTAGATFPQPFRHAPLGMLQRVFPTVRIGIDGWHGRWGMVVSLVLILHARGKHFFRSDRQDLEAAMAEGRFPQIAQLPVGDETACQTQERFGHDQADHPFLVTLQELHQGRADPLIGLAEHFALGRTDVLRLLLPLAIDLRLLVADVFHQHSLPQALVKILQPLDFLVLDPQGFRHDLGRLQRRLRNRAKMVSMPLSRRPSAVCAASVAPCSFNGMSKLP